MVNTKNTLSSLQNVGWSIKTEVINIDVNNEYKVVDGKYEYDKIILEESKSKYVFI